MKPARQPRFELTPIALAIRQAGLAAIAVSALAPLGALAQVPTGGTVTQGTAAIQNVSPTQQVITQGSSRAVINWQSFSIGQSSAVQFVQPSSSAVILNRVTGANPSAIFGSLSANGQVFLVNPFGVYFSPTARVDVTGLMATTLNIRDSDFMLGNYSFSRDPSSPATARVVNEGLINARTGGYVVLAGDYAANRGTIEARGGSVVLASGNRMTLDLQGDGLVKLAVDEKTVSNLAAVENAGTIIADGGRVVMTAAVARDITGTVVNNTGVVQARGTEFRDGAIYLTGSGGDVSSSGKLDASGSRGGQVTVQSTGTTLVSGEINASGAVAAGGNVQILGDRVGLIDNAQVNASGTTGGGTVLVGGDFQGKNADVQNAERTYIGPNATIVADAGQTGDGGKVVVWADGDTRYYGNISARGGAQSGNGGSAEVSGKQVLDYNGKTDLRAPAGRTGTLLLDPFNLTIQNGANGANTNVAGGPTFSSSGTGSILTDGTINNQLTTASVVVQTAGGPTLELGDITVATGSAIVAPANGNSLTLNASHSIIVDAPIDFATNASSGNLILQATGGTISGSGALKLGTGSLQLTANTGISATSAASTISFGNSVGTVSISNTKASGLTVSGNDSGPVAITETAGDLTVAGINSLGNTIGLTANAGTISQTSPILGSTLTTSSKNGTSLAGANMVTGFNASNSTDGDITLNNTAPTLTVAGVSQNATTTPPNSVSITNAGNISITGATSTSDGAISVTATGGSLTVGNTVTAGGTGRDVTLTTTGNNDINVNAAVNAAGDNITLNSGGAINGNGTLTSSGLALSTATGSIGSSGTPLALSVDRFEAQAPLSIFVANDKALTIGNVSGGIIGVSTTAPLFSSGISISAPALTVAEAIATTLSIAPVSIAPVTLSADQFAINAGVSGSLVTLAPKTAGTNIELGTGAAAAGLDQTELLRITAGLTRIGSPTVKAGNISFVGDLTLTNAQGPLSLYANGTVSQNAGTKITTPGGFAAQTSGGALTLDQPNNNFHTVAIDAGAGNISLRNDSNFTVATVDGVKGIKGGNVTLVTGQAAGTGDATTTDLLTLTTPSGLAPGDVIRITGGGTDFVTTVQTAAGNTVTISQNVTATGTIDTSIDPNKLTLSAAPGVALAKGDLITIAGAGSGGGTVAFTTTIADITGTTITLSSGAFTSVTGVTVFRGRPAAATTAGNALTVTRLPTTGNISSGSKLLTVASTTGLQVNDRIVVPGAGANGADLLTSITGIAGNVLTLANNAGTDSKDAPIAKPSFIGNSATTTAGLASAGTTTVFVASTAGFSVGDAISIAGAGGSGGTHNVTITNVDGGVGTITLSAATATDVTDAVITHTDQGITATGTLTLQSNLPGGFTQAGGPVNASTLVLKGYGPDNIGGAGAGNQISTLAADVTGSVSVGTRGKLTIGSAGGITGVTTRSVLTVPAGVGGGAAYTDANIALSTNSDNTASGTMLQIDQPIVAGAKELYPAADDPSDAARAVRTGQVLLFLVNDTTATGTGLIEGNLLSLAAEVTKGTFDVTTKVSSLSLSGSKEAKVNNVAYTGNLTALNLGLQDISTSASVTSADNTSTLGAGTIFTTGLVPDAHAGRKLVITSGAGKDETYSIVSNTATKIILAGPLNTTPVAGDTFKIGEDKDIRAGNVALRTGGDISVTTANMTGNLAISAEKANSRATFTFLSSSGNNIFIQADQLLVTKALTTPGVNVLLRPFTKTNTVGIESASDPGMPHATVTGSIDTTVSDVTLNVASTAGFNVGDSITIPGAGPGGANLVASIASINGNALTLNDVAEASVTNVTVANNAVAAGATNYSANTLGQFHQNANITIGGDDTGATFPPTFPVGITGTPWLSGNVFIGSDGAVNLGGQNLFVSTSGNITSNNLGPVGNVGLVAGGAGGITLANLNSTGANLLFKANSLSMPGAASAYTTAAGVNVTLQPYTLTNTVGVGNAVDYHNGAVGNIDAGSDIMTISNVIGTLAAGDVVEVLGAGPGGAKITPATILASGTEVLLAAPATATVNNVTVTFQSGFITLTTTGSIKAGSNILLVNSASSIAAGTGITVNGASGAGGDLSTTVNSIGPDAVQLDTFASTSVTDAHIGKAPPVTINTNYAVALLNKFNATAKITVSGTTTSPAGGNTLSGDIHIGSDASSTNPFDIGSRTLTASTTGTVFNHAAVSVTTSNSGTSGTVPPITAWTAGQTPVGGVSANGGAGGGGNNGGGNNNNNNNNNNSGNNGSNPGGGGPPSSTPSNPGNNSTSGGNPPSGSNPPSTPSNPTPPTTPTTPVTNPLPDPTGTPGPDGTVVVGYTPDPDPVDPPGTPPGIPPVVVVTPPDPGTPPGTPTDPVTPPDPTIVVIGPTDPGTPPGTPTDPVTPPDPTIVVIGPTDPGTPPGGPIDPGTGTPPDPTIVVIGPTDPGGGTPPGGPTDPGTGTPPDPTIVVIGPTDPGGGTPPGGPTDPGTGTPPDPTIIATGPTDPGSGTPPGGPTDPGTGTPPDPTIIATGPTDPGSGTPPGGPTDPGTGTPPDPTIIATGPTDPGSGTPPGGPTDPGTGTPPDPTIIATGPTDPGSGTPPGGPTDPGTGTPGGGPTDPTIIATGPTDPGGGTPPGGPTDPGTGTPGGGPTDPTIIATGPTDPGGGTPPGGPTDPGTGTPGGGPTDPTVIATGPTDPGTTTTPGGPTDPGTSTPGGTTVAGGPTGGTGGPGTGTTTTTTTPDGTTTTTTSVTGNNGSTTTTTTVTTTGGGTTTTVTTAAPDGTVTTVSANGTTTIVSPNGATTTVLADGTTTTTAADGTVTSGGPTTVASNGDSSQSGAECPPGTSASKSESGAQGACVATPGGSGTSAGGPRVAARPSAAPVTQGTPESVFATRDYGVNLYQAGRRNGPGTPDPGQRR